MPVSFLWLSLVLLFSNLAAAEDRREVFVDVALIGHLIDFVEPEWAVFVYAAVPGSRLPLASQKIKVSDLPEQVKLTENMNLLPGLTLANVTEIELVAKISQSPNPHKIGPNDLIGRSSVVSFKDDTKLHAVVLIDHQLD